jgi:CheY-like chemotaxis protein
VVIIEDNADVALMLGELLSLLGHEVALAESGDRGLALAASRATDVVFCDIGLPKMSGYEVARAIRAKPDSREVVLVALTGYGQPEDRRRTAEAGFDAHLVKPVDLHALEGVLARVDQLRSSGAPSTSRASRR